MNRGQITLYAVIGLLILIIISMIFFINFDDEPVSKTTFDTSNVEFMIDECINEVGRRGLKILGENGNYIQIPKQVKINGKSLWIHQYSNIQPILNSSVGDFQQYINTNIKQCFDFSGFSGYKISVGNASSTVQFSAEDVLISVHMPTNITFNDRSKTIEEYENIINIRYRRIYERAKAVVDAHYLQNFDYLRALEFVDQRDFNISYSIIDNNTLDFTIRDESDNEGSVYEFTFVTNLNRTHLKRSVNIDEELLNFVVPYKIYSPDKMAYLELSPGTIIKNADDISVFATYPDIAVRPDVTTHLVYKIEGEDISEQLRVREDLIWNLSYPVYNFEPNGTRFYEKLGKESLQNLRIYWDEDKNPNRGAMGMLYRGSFSNYNWTPLPMYVNYSGNYVETQIPGFSEYTVVDCARQVCREVGIKSESEPAGMCFGYVFDIVLIVVVIIIIVILIILAFFTGGATLTGIPALLSTTGGMIFLVAAGLTVGSIAYSSITAEWTESSTAVTFVPTCDQVVESYCRSSDKLKSGYGEMLDEKIPEDGSRDFIGMGGIPNYITSVAEECEKGPFKCYSCDIDCRVNYK